MSTADHATTAGADDTQALTVAALRGRSGTDPGGPPAMLAWRQERYGAPDGVRLEQIPVPTPGPGQALLHVRATALNAADVRLMRGEPLFVRTAFGLRRPRAEVRGMDVAGTVVELGPDAGGFEVGDEVVGELPSGGGLAPFAVAPVARLVRRPAGVPPVTAATLPMAGGTAHQALERAAVAGGSSAPGRASVASGDRVLIIGASGGVGTFAVQLAAHRGAEVWALAGARNRALVAELGATKVFDYRAVHPGSPELPDGTFDAVIDIAGTASLRALRRLIRPGGSVVLVSGEGNRVWGPMGRVLGAMLLSMGSKRPVRPLMATAKSEVLDELLWLTEAGSIRPVIERTWPLAEASAALAHLDGGHTVGKVVVLGAQR